MTAPDDLSQGLAATLRLGMMMLRSGTTAARVREAMTRVATGLGIERLVVTVSFDFMVATVWRNGATVTQAIDSPAPGINAARIATIDTLSRRAQPGLSAADLDHQLDIIERTAPLHALATTAVAVGLACGCFSFLNNGNPPMILATILAAGLGELVRSLLLRRRVNQLAVTVICAIGAASLYVAIAATCARAGIAVLHGAGFISCVLFLIPGFPLVAALLDLVRYDFTAGVARLAYGAMILLGGGFGVSTVAAVADLTTSPLPVWETNTILLRAVASFIGGCGFAILYNSPWRTVVTVGLLALIGNDLRLALHGMGVGVASATFVGAFCVGLCATVARQVLSQPRILFTVPGIIVMVPGTPAFETIVRFNAGDVGMALQAAIPGLFALGAMGFGLAAAHLLTQRAWMLER